MAVKIVVDSTSNIPNNILKELDIKLVSLNVLWNGESKREVDINHEKFYKELENAESLPTSSQPSVQELLDLFKSIVENGDSIVGLFISSEMSGTYSTALMVKNMILEEFSDAKIEIIDSRSNCMQTGLVAIECAKAAKENFELEKIIKIADSGIKKGRFLFMPKTLTYLKKGGRIGGAGALFGNLLKIIPILTVDNGVTEVFAKVRTRRKAIDRLVEELINDIEDKKIKAVVVHHINCLDDGKALKGVILEKLNQNGIEIENEILVVPINPVIGVHVGPGSIGIAYLK